MQSRLPTVAGIGLLATAMQVVGYYATAEIRGFDASVHYVAVWSLCAVPRRAGVRCRRVIAYDFRLGYTSAAALFGVIALLLAGGLGRHREQHTSLARWLVPALLAGVAGNALLGLVVG